MLSYWEQQSFLHYNHIVAGAGITGLSAAIEIKTKQPQARVLVLERGLLPTGASSRNAGFACMGSVTELLDDLKTNQENEVVALFAARKTGLGKLRARLGDERIGYQEDGSFELIAPEDENALEQIDYLNQLIHPVAGKNAFSIRSEKIAGFGFNAHAVKHLVENNCEGSIHTGKMLRALTDYAIAQGIEIKTGAEVVRFEEENKSVTVIVNDPFRKQDLRLQSQTFCICTNAFAKQLLPDENLVPGRGQVLVTTPISNLPFRGIFHMERGYFYFREIDGRVMIGGGRNLFFQEEGTETFALTDGIQNALEEKLRRVILPETAFEIEQRWSGIMAFGENKHPVVRQFSPRVFGAFRMGGMGVALGSEVAVRVAEMMDASKFS